MRTMVNRIVALFAFVLITGCGQNTSGGYDPDGDVSPIDGGDTNFDASLSDSSTNDTSDANVVDASDGGVGADYDGGGDSGSDASVPECYSNDDCPEGQVCVGNECVCDGDDDDGGGSCASGKTLLCHYPPGNPANLHNICVGTPAVPAHLAHGDSLGVCP